MAEIYLEMSELFDIQVNAQKEKNFRGSRKLPQAHKNVCNENETNKQEKNDVHVKMLLIEGSLYKAHKKNQENDLNEL